MKLKNLIKNSLFAKSFNLAKSNPSKIGLMVLFDVMFFIVVSSLNFLVQYFAQTIILLSEFYSRFLFIVFSLIYYLIILFVYSLFKYFILNYIKSSFAKSGFSFDRLGKFYLLNVVIVIIFVILSLLAGFMLINVKQPYQIYFFFVIASPFWAVINKYSLLSLHSLIFYIFINFVHSLFYERVSLKETLERGFIITFSRIKSYKEILFSIIAWAVILWAVLYGGDYLVNVIASKNYNFYIKFYSIFTTASTIFFGLFVYSIIMINRFSFYSLARGNK